MVDIFDLYLDCQMLPYLGPIVEIDQTSFPTNKSMLLSCHVRVSE